MSKVVYEGSVVGLKVVNGRFRASGGDTANPFDYMVYCTCEREGKPTMLGPLGRFTQNAQGMRTAHCPVCNHITVIDKGGQVTAYVPFALLPKH